ncbi:MAG TPA: DinB family protein, partial [Gemmatimonadaceae bacterium]|nr:DinB family protein [Gemmatimonadaceae bacterium]
RAGEFAAREGESAAALLARLERVLDDADAALARLSPDDVTTPRTIQGRNVTVLEAIYHVLLHFGLHLGQIILIAKERAPGAIRFYEDAGGLARPLWKEMGTEGRGRPAAR